MACSETIALDSSRSNDWSSYSVAICERAHGADQRVGTRVPGELVGVRPRLHGAFQCQAQARSLQGFHSVRASGSGLLPEPAPRLWSPALVAYNPVMSEMLAPRLHGSALRCVTCLMSARETHASDQCMLSAGAASERGVRGEGDRV